MLAVILLLGSPNAHAADVVQGANTLAMGGTGVAAPADNAGITLNPGLIGLVERYDFHVHGRLGPDLGLQWGASAMDGRTSDVVAAGFAYSGDRFEPDFTNADLPAWRERDEEIRNRKRLHDFAGAVAVPLLSRRVSIGIGGVFTSYNHDQQGQGTRFDMHGGVGIRPVDGLTVGASLRNFLPGEDENRPTELLFGLRLQNEERLAVEVNAGHTFNAGGGLTLALDGPVAPPLDPASPWTFGGGVQAGVGSTVLRAGGRWSGPLDRSYVTLGIGTDDRGSGAVEYGVSIPVSGDVRFGALLHQISARFGAPQPIDEP